MSTHHYIALTLKHLVSQVLYSTFRASSTFSLTLSDIKTIHFNIKYNPHNLFQDVNIYNKFGKKTAEKFHIMIWSVVKQTAAILYCRNCQVWGLFWDVTTEHLLSAGCLITITQSNTSVRDRWLFLWKARNHFIRQTLPFY